MLTLELKSSFAIHYLCMLVHNRCKWHSAEKRHAVSEDASADENFSIHENNSILIS